MFLDEPGSTQPYLGNGDHQLKLATRNAVVAKHTSTNIGAGMMFTQQ